MGKAKYILNKNTNQSMVNEADSLSLISLVRKGILFNAFISMVKKIPFSLSEWSDLLHISHRTMQRYEKEEKAFDSIQSEKILQITFLYKFGSEVFNNEAKFNTWIDSNNVALGGIKPRSLLDSAFGIDLIRNELIKIEHGIPA